MAEVLSDEEKAALLALSRKAFSDRLDDEQRKRLVDSFVQGEQDGPDAPRLLHDFRFTVRQLQRALQQSLEKALSEALSEFASRGS